MSTTCDAQLRMWDGEYEGDCELPANHDGDHWDGDFWFDDDGERTDDPQLPGRPPPKL